MHPGSLELLALCSQLREIRAACPVVERAQLIERIVEPAQRVVERAEQQLQQDAGGMKWALPKLGDPFGEVLSNLVQDQTIPLPDCEDAQSGAKQVHLDHL